MVNVEFLTQAKLDQDSAKEWSGIVVETGEKISTVSYLNLMYCFESIQGVLFIDIDLAHTAYQKNGDGMLRL